MGGVFPKPNNTRGRIALTGGDRASLGRTSGSLVCSFSEYFWFMGEKGLGVNVLVVFDLFKPTQRF